MPNPSVWVNIQKKKKKKRTKAMGPSSMLLFFHVFQFCMGGAQDTTPPEWGSVGSNSANLWSRISDRPPDASVASFGPCSAEQKVFRKTNRKKISFVYLSSFYETRILFINSAKECAQKSSKTPRKNKTNRKCRFRKLLILLINWWSAWYCYSIYNSHCGLKFWG